MLTCCVYTACVLHVPSVVYHAVRAPVEPHGLLRRAYETLTSKDFVNENEHFLRVRKALTTVFDTLNS